MSSKFNETHQKIEHKKNGLLTLVYKGQWFLFDIKTKIYQDGKLIATESTKKGFSVEIALKASTMKLKLTLPGMKSTRYTLEDIDLSKNHRLIIEYDTNRGRYSSNPKLITDGNN